MNDQLAPWRFMVDPSLLLSTRGFGALLENGEYQSALVVSSSFLFAIRNGVDPRVLMRWSGTNDEGSVGTLTDRAGWLSTHLTVDQAFSFEQGLPDETGLLGNDRLYRLARGGLVSRVHADELAYVQTESVMVSRWRAPLTALTNRVGGAVVTYGRRLRDEFLAVAIPAGSVPGVLTPAFFARVGAKWLVIGGATAGTAALGGPLAAMLGAAAIPVVRAFDD